VLVTRPSPLIYGGGLVKSDGGQVGVAFLGQSDQKWKLVCGTVLSPAIIRSIRVDVERKQ
jgi:hypothetical protein